MAKITKLEPQKRKKGRFNIYLDGKFAAGASEEVIIALSLRENQEITPKKLKEFEKKEEEARGYGSALRFLSFRPRSEKEIFTHLKKKFSEKLVKKTIARLKKDKLLDDEEFAKAFIKNREILRPMGKRRLFWELKQKGVSEEVVKKILEKEYNQDKEEKLAQELVEKRLQALKGLPKERVYQKLVGFLQRRGFSWGITKKVLKDELH